MGSPATLAQGSQGKRLESRIWGQDRPECCAKWDDDQELSCEVNVKRAWKSFDLRSSILTNVLWEQDVSGSNPRSTSAGDRRDLV